MPTGRTAQGPAALLATLRRVTTPAPDAAEEAAHVRRGDSLRPGAGRLFDVVITNPPFKEAADPAAHSHLDLPQTGKAELLFAALALQSLRAGRTAALLLPDNFLWARTRAHAALRKALVEGCALRAVATIPAAAFHPHTAAKTCAVIFRKGGATGTVAFYKITDHEGGLSAAASHFAVGATREGSAGEFTAGEFTAFIKDGGYSRPEYWLSDGWDMVIREGWNAPLYWRQDEAAWSRFTLSGRRAVAADQPVTHLSYYEADAFARWSGARLPTEAEWEVAAAAAPETGLAEVDDVAWQWTASPCASTSICRARASAIPPRSMT